MNRHQSYTPERKPIRLIRPVYFVWVVAPVLVWLAYLTFGLPHVIWSYEWRPLGPNSFAEFSRRHYTRCTYAGPYGVFTEYPTDGTCGLVRFKKKRGTAQ